MAYITTDIDELLQPHNLEFTVFSKMNPTLKRKTTKEKTLLLLQETKLLPNR